MGAEHERKYLLKDGWQADVDMDIYTWIQQGYLSLDKERIVRLREVQLVSPSGFVEQGWLTIKGLNTEITRPEWEYEIPVSDLREMMALVTGAVIEKKRYRFGRYEIDVFEGANHGLVVAELELKTENEVYKVVPPWLGQEVSDDPAYFNSSLVHHPWTTWDVHPTV